MKTVPLKPGSSSHPVSAYLVLALGILAVSSASILIRFAQREAPSLVIAAYRLTLASLVLLPITLRRNSAELFALKRKQVCALLAAGVLLALHFATWITSLELTTVASSVVLVSTAPLWVALASPVFLKEKIHPAVWVGLGLALLGSLIIALCANCENTAGLVHCDLGANFWSGRSLLGNGLALIGAICVAGYLIIGRRLQLSLSLPVYIQCVYGAAAVCLLALAWASGANFLGARTQAGFQVFSLPVWLCLAGLALGPQLLGHTSYNWALRYLPAASVSVALLGEPIGTILLAFFILRETPSWIELVGGGLILLGIFITSRNSGH